MSLFNDNFNLIPLPDNKKEILKPNFISKSIINKKSKKSDNIIIPKKDFSHSLERQTIDLSNDENNNKKQSDIDLTFITNSNNETDYYDPAFPNDYTKYMG